MNKFNQYKNHWNNKEFNKVFLRFKKFILGAELDFARQVSMKLKSNLDEMALKILDIGIGDGVVSLEFLKELRKYKKISKYIGIDISPELIAESRSKETDFRQVSEKTEFCVGDATIYKPKEGYNLIIAFNSWYGIPFEEISRYLSSLENGGILAILLNSEDNITLDLTRKFVEPIISSEDLTKWLTRNKLNYHNIRLITKDVNKGNFLSGKGELLPETEFFFRYLLRKIHEPLGAVSRYIGTKNEGYFNMPQNLIIIPKQ